MEKTKEERTKETVERLKDKLALPQVKLSIGAGLHFKDEKEYINHDGIQNGHIDIVSEFGDIPLPDACIDYLELGDSCEHLPQWRVDEVWTEWTRILKKGAKIRVGTPNFHRNMTVYTLNTIFGKTMPSGWMDISATDAEGNKYETKYHIMHLNDLTPYEYARRNIYAWGTTPYETHYLCYTMETLTELMTKHGFVDIDFSDSPPQELNDPKNSWWFSVHATYKGK